MRRRPVTTLLTIVAVIFVGALGIFYIQEGSFEGAGERMDGAVSALGDELQETADDALEATDNFIDDVADGADDS